MGRHRGPRGGGAGGAGSHLAPGAMTKSNAVDFETISHNTVPSVYGSHRGMSRTGAAKGGCRHECPRKGPRRRRGRQSRGRSPPNWASGSVWRSAARRWWSQRPPVAATTVRAAAPPRPPRRRPRRRRAAAPPRRPPAERPPRRPGSSARRRRRQHGQRRLDDQDRVARAAVRRAGVDLRARPPGRPGVREVLERQGRRERAQARPVGLRHPEQLQRRPRQRPQGRRRRCAGDHLERRLLRHRRAVPGREQDPGVRLRHQPRLLRPGQADVLLADGQLDRVPEQRRHEVPRRPGPPEDRRPVRPEPGQRQRRPRHRQRRADRRRAAHLRELRRGRHELRRPAGRRPGGQGRGCPGGVHQLLRHRPGPAAGQPQPDRRQGRRAQRLARLLAGHPEAVRLVGRGPHVGGLHGHVAEPVDPGRQDRTWTP